MGRASRDKWIKRALQYEDLIRNRGYSASKKYFDHFKKTDKLTQGAGDLVEEREVLEEERRAGAS